MPIATNKPVVVTGITGFVAAHCALTLLEKGYTVRGTVRSQSKADQFSQLPHFKKYVQKKKLEFSIVEDVASSDFTEAMSDGVEVVLHLASPFHMGKGEPESTFLIPAKKGTENALKTAHKVGTVKNFVLTSSFAAVLSMDDPGLPLSGKVYTEDDWNRATYEQAKETDNPGFAYCASKKVAEKAAYDYQKENGLESKMTISSICGPMIMGPLVHSLDKLDNLNESLSQVWEIVSGKCGKELPATGFPAFADVRDIANAHITAFEKNVQGRFLIYSGPYDSQRIVDLAVEKFPNEYKGVKGSPGETIDKNPKVFKLDTTKAEKELDFKPKSFETTFGDMIGQMFELQKQGK